MHLKSQENAAAVNDEGRSLGIFTMDRVHWLNHHQATAKESSGDTTSLCNDVLISMKVSQNWEDTDKLPAICKEKMLEVAEQGLFDQGAKKKKSLVVSAVIRRDPKIY